MLGRFSNHGDEQAIAPLLIISRLVNRSALTGDVTSGNTGPICFRSQWESTVCYGTLPDGSSMSSTDAHGSGESTAELGVGVENTMNDNSR